MPFSPAAAGVGLALSMDAPRRQSYCALICLVLALGTAALYWPITSHPFILYDDEQYVLTNPHVTSGLSWTNTVWAFKSGEAANWHPLTWISHQIDCTLYGVKAGGHHFTNLLFHVVNTLLVFFFCGAPQARSGAAHSWRRCSRGILCTSSPWPGLRSARTC